MNIGYQNNRGWSRAAGQAARVTGILAAILFCTLFVFGRPVLAEEGIAPGTLPPAKVGSPYSVQLLTLGMPGSPTYNWTIISGGLPPGLYMDSSTGLIHGTPDSEGNYTFIVDARGSAGAEVQQGFCISVSSVPITFSTSILTDAMEGSQYTMQITAAGGTPPYHWSLAGGPLPDGLTIDPGTGIISGIPSEGACGGYPIIVKVTDSNRFPVYGQQAFNLAVKKGFYEVNISIDSSLMGVPAKVKIDMNEPFELAGGDSILISFPVSTRHTITVDSAITDPSDAGIQYKTDRNTVMVDDYMTSAMFHYDTYYLLAIDSENGMTEGNGWYKSLSLAKWKVTPVSIPMTGFFGFFQGTEKPDLLGDIEIMDQPRIMAVSWKPDFTMPIIWLSLIALSLSAAGFFVYRMVRRRRQALYPQPVYRHYKTREEITEEFFHLLQKYQQELKAVQHAEQLPLEAVNGIEQKLLPYYDRMVSAGMLMGANSWRTRVTGWIKARKIVRKQEKHQRPVGDHHFSPGAHTHAGSNYYYPAVHEFSSLSDVEESSSTEGIWRQL